MRCGLKPAATDLHGVGDGEASAEQHDDSPLHLSVNRRPVQQRRRGPRRCGIYSVVAQLLLLLLLLLQQRMRHIYKQVPTKLISLPEDKRVEPPYSRTKIYVARMSRGNSS